MRTYDNFSPTIPVVDEPVSQEEIPAFNNDILNGDKKKSSRKGNKTNSKNKTTSAETKSAGPGAIKKVKNFATSQTTRWILGLFMGFLAVYIGIAFFSYFVTCITDQAEINNTAIGRAGEIDNAAGEGGARLSEFLINECFGLGSFVIVLWLFAMALKHLTGRPRFKSVNFTIKCLVALITVSLIVGLLTIGMQSSVNWGGFHGRYVNEFIIHFLGWSGAVILCLFMVCCFVLICMRDVVKWGIRLRNKRREARRIRLEQEKERLAREMEIEEMRRFEDQSVSQNDEVVEKEETTDPAYEGQMVFGGENDGLYQEVPDIEDPEYATYNLESENSSRENPIDQENNEDLFYKYAPAKEEVIETEKLEPISDIREELSSDSPEIESTKKEPEELESTVDETEPPLDMVVNVNSISQVNSSTTISSGFDQASFPYKFPPFELLREGEVKVSVDTEEQLENKERIKRTLLDFDIPITSIEATIGPTVTLYEIVPDKGVRVAKIRSLVDDIALSLSAEGVRIIAPIPGKGTVGIEVANKDPQTVSMRTVLKSKKYQESKYQLPIAIGSTISNEVFIADLAKMPHLLVAGATGQGKSVGLNAIIASLLFNKRPDELKFVMVDPKQVEFSLYAKIESHYLAKIPESEEAIITDTDKVVGTLSSLCIEMDNRYQLLKEAHTRNIIEYNDKIKDKKLNPKEGHRFLPYIVVIVDEFSDLIMTAGKEVEVPIARLAQKARAVGMHVIIATQRPSTNVITGIIKANFPARMAFKVSSGVDSKTILDTTGAQQLIGRGDMLISNSGPMTRVQCAFIDTPEVESICDYISRQPYAQGAYLLPEPLVSKGDSDMEGAGGFSSERDPLFEEVARLVVTSNNASTSSLQRRYSIGYNRAGKIMDQLEAAGIVGPAQGGKPRAVLMDPVSLDLLLEN